MSRAIKLRVWDADNRCFTPLVHLQQLGDPALTIQQFTGVVDAFGREIWEGDIVKWVHFDPATAVYHECYFAVGLQGGCFGTYRADEEDEDFTPYESAASPDVVVGNVLTQAYLLSQTLELQW